MTEKRRTLTDSDLAEALTAALAASALAPTSGVLVAAVAVAPMAVRKVVDLTRRYVEQNTEALQRAWDNALHEWVSEWRHVLPQVVKELGERVSELEARAEDPEFQRVVDNFGVEASREAIRERQVMLAYATAGAFNVTLTVAQASRAERLLRELDPDDVLWLAALDLAAGDDARWQVWLASPAADVLTATGCIRIHTESGGLMFDSSFAPPSRHRAVVTREGRLVLSVARPYICARPTPTVTPRQT